MARARYGIREEIRDAIDAFYRALTHENLKAVEAIWAQVPYASVAGRSGDVQQGWDGVRRYLEQRFRKGQPLVKVRLTKMLCHAIGDVAWVSGTEIRTISTPDGPKDERLRMTGVLERQGSGWQIVSYHASLPMETATPATESG
ncbi:MAG: nuclear transport factor 2 family protein [Chloroflexota bacterium]|nr:MAG: hypothetical protein DLM71_07125 [Chloroflexota bacterium]